MAGNSNKDNNQPHGSGINGCFSTSNSNSASNYRSPRSNNTASTNNHPLQQIWSRNFADIIKLEELELEQLGKFYAFNFDFLSMHH